MKTDETISTMREAQHEIQGLRRSNEVLSAKVEVFESMMCLLHTQPATRSMGASPDVVFALEKRILELEREKEHEPRAELRPAVMERR